jgi:hypothetical protein
MKLILEITSHAGDGRVIHRAVEEFPSTLGRGYHNDIILSDPHVSAEHIRIDYDGENWWARDLGSENGMFVNDKPCKGCTAQIHSGDVLRIGRTEIRAFSPGHPVPDAVRLQRANPLFLALSRPRNVWFSFILAVATTMAWTYLEVWSDQPGMTLAMAAGSAFCIIMLWSTLWSVAGRLVKHKTHFQSHVALISLYIVGSAILWYVQSYLNFLFSENNFAVIAGYGLNIVLFGLLLYGALSLAADMPKRRRGAVSLYFSGGIAASLFLLGYAGTLNFSPDPLYPYTLEPYLAHLAPAETLDGFMEGNKAIFASDEFRQAEPAEGARR